MALEDSIEAKLEFPYRFGKNIKVDIDFIKEATLYKNGDTAVYIYEIKCPSARSVNLIFDQFALNDHSILKIYNNEGTFTYGPVTSSSNPKGNEFWTDIIKGEHIIIELCETSSSELVSNQLHISSVIFGYRNAFKAAFKTTDDYGDALACNNDIACPEGDNWRVEANAVAMVLLADGTRWCSGSLVNNVPGDISEHYFLTAFHCVEVGVHDCALSDAEKNAVNNWLFRFFYQSPTCGGSDGTEYITINGADFRAAYQPTDFALIELRSAPSPSTSLGWTRTTTAASSGVGISHPMGDVKKISIENNALTLSNALSWSDGCTTPVNTHWNVVYDDGTMEPGSSGSPFLNQGHRVVGQLHGGIIVCPPGASMHYGRLDKSWTGGGSSSTRLRDWLDPSNTGTTSVNTKYSITTPTISGPYSICSSGVFSYTITGVPVNCTVYWENSSNISRTSSQGSNPCSFIATGSGTGWIRVTIKSTSVIAI